MQTKFLDGSIMVCGILGKDAEFKTVGEKNASICKFGVKVGNRMVKGADGRFTEVVGEDGKPIAVWVNCQCWHSAARAAQNFKKLDVVLAIGKPEKRSYTNKNGEQKIDEHLNCEFVLKMSVGDTKNIVQSASVLVNLDDFEEVLSDDGVPF